MFFSRLLGFVLVVWAAGPILAAEHSPEPSLLGFSFGFGEVLNADKVPLFAAEYRFAYDFHGLHPVLIGTRATDGANYLGMAALYNFELNPKWRLTASFGPGYYSRNRSAKDLGSSIEFLSNLELSTRVGRDHRLALSFGHVSNGSIGNHNPGSEILRLIYLIPFR